MSKDGTAAHRSPPSAYGNQKGQAMHVRVQKGRQGDDQVQAARQAQFEVCLTLFTA